MLLWSGGLAARDVQYGAPGTGLAPTRGAPLIDMRARSPTLQAQRSPTAPVPAGPCTSRHQVPKRAYLRHLTTYQYLQYSRHMGSHALVANVTAHWHEVDREIRPVPSHPTRATPWVPSSRGDGEGMIGT